MSEDLIHLISRCTHLIIIYYKNNSLEKSIDFGSATGFIWENNKQHYLITNWHVVSGKNSITNQCIHQFGCRPNYIEMHGYDDLGTSKIYTIKLYNSEEVNDDEKCWIEHKELKNGRMIDVVAIPLESNLDMKLYPLNLVKGFDPKIDLEVGMDLNIVGYPLFEIKEDLWPIWMAGSIASEPSIDFNEEQLLLVNSVTYSGMSGSPVIWTYQNKPIKQRINGKLSTLTNSVAGDFKKFVGIYSGRVVDENIDKDKSSIVALGRVWNFRVLDKLFFLSNQ